MSYWEMSTYTIKPSWTLTAAMAIMRINCSKGARQTHVEVDYAPRSDGIAKTHFGARPIEHEVQSVYNLPYPTKSFAMSILMVIFLSTVGDFIFDCAKVLIEGAKDVQKP